MTDHDGISQHDVLNPSSLPKRHPLSQRRAWFLTQVNTPVSSHITRSEPSWPLTGPYVEVLNFPGGFAVNAQTEAELL